MLKVKNVCIHDWMFTLSDLHQCLVGSALNSVRRAASLLRCHDSEWWKPWAEQLMCSRRGIRCCKCAAVVLGDGEVLRWSNMHCLSLETNPPEILFAVPLFLLVPCDPCKIRMVK